MSEKEKTRKSYLNAATIADLVNGFDFVHGGWYFTKLGKLAPVDGVDEQSARFFSNEEIREVLKSKCLELESAILKSAQTKHDAVIGWLLENHDEFLARVARTKAATSAAVCKGEST